MKMLDAVEKDDVDAAENYFRVLMYKEKIWKKEWELLKSYGMADRIHIS